MCQTLPRVCCAQQGGDPLGAGDDCNNNGLHDACEPTVACCDSSSGCQNVLESCCTTGVSAGPGTACGDANGNGFDDECGEPRACCTPNHGTGPCDFCDNHDLYICVVLESGTPISPANAGCNGLPDDDDDNVPDPCDNCDPGDPAQCGVGEDCANNDQTDDDGDGVGNQCDNCDPNQVVHHCNDPGFTCNNPDQADADGDGVGDACDNCDPNQPAHHCNDPGFTCNNPNQADCDGDGIGDACQPNCDGDAFPDDCGAEDDIDGDGILDDVDVCDFTPPLPTANGGDIVRDANHPLYGTFLGDIDGDCDVDANDAALFDQLFNTEFTGDGDCTGNDETEQRAVGCACASAGCCPVCPPPCFPGGGGGLE